MKHENEKTFFIMFQGKELGIINANNYEEARSRIEEVITIEEMKA